VISILHPNQSAAVLADAGTTGLLRPSSTAQAAVENLAREIGQRHWASAYSKLAKQGRIHGVRVCTRPEREPISAFARTRLLISFNCISHHPRKHERPHFKVIKSRVRAKADIGSVQVAYKL